MKLVFNGYDIPITKANNEKWIDFGLFLFSINTNVGTNKSKELKLIDSKDYFKEKLDGRRVRTNINGNGLVRFLSYSQRITPLEKDDIIYQLKNHNMIDSNIVLNRTRKETNMGDDLSLFLVPFGKKLIKQKVLCEKYSVDFIIDNLVIEYDENNHATYNQEKEIEREADIISLGYSFLRISDKHENIYNIGLIYKKLEECFL